MASPASIAKHPIHPMLIVFPVGLWIFSLVSDVIYLMQWGTSVWREVALYTMIGGLVGALLAAIPGLADLLTISSARIRKIGVWHMSINLVVVALFALNIWMRMSGTASESLTVWLSVLGVVLLAVSGWLGGEMVYVHAVAVEPPAGGETEKQAAPRRVA